jgi:hypothetical protein
VADNPETVVLRVFNLQFKSSKFETIRFQALDVSPEPDHTGVKEVNVVA